MKKAVCSKQLNLISANCADCNIIKIEFTNKKFNTTCFSKLNVSFIVL